jgi:NADH dehydrogenase/NADH:ubiquinone oxidoreductase subunit G
MTPGKDRDGGTPKKQVTVIINGKKYPADEGEILLRVAIRNNIAIPHLCYEPSLDPYGACRLCMVEVVKR